MAAVIIVVSSLALAVAPPPPAAAQRPELYRPPVDASVIDPFRPPDQPWLAGNRGLEYDTTAGTVVAAIGSGLVVFAGPVAGQLFVTVLHGDGIRSSYSYLSAVSVTVGERVRGGQAVGFTSDIPFHLGARVGDVYVDPAGLFGARVGAASVFLVPLDESSRSAAGRSVARGAFGTSDPSTAGQGTGVVVAAVGSLVASATVAAAVASDGPGPSRGGPDP